MRDMLLNDCKNKCEKVEIENLSEISLYKNNLLLKF